LILHNFLAFASGFSRVKLEESLKEVPMEKILIGAIGRCPRCFEFLQLPDEVPIERMPMPSRCICGGIITPKSQRMACVDGEWKQVRWLNKYARWTETKPDKPFILQGTYRTWLVLVDYVDSSTLNVPEDKLLLPRPKPRLATSDGKLVKRA